MTTGRINQVTTFHPALRTVAVVGTRRPEGHLSRREFVNQVIETHDRDDPTVAFRLSTYSLSPRSVTRSPCTPISQVSGTLLLVFFTDEDHTLRRRLPAVGVVCKTRTTTADPHVVNRVRFGHRQAIHISHHRRPTLQTGAIGLLFRHIPKPGAHPSQASVARMASSTFDSRLGNTSHPTEKEAYWTSQEDPSSTSFHHTHQRSRTEVLARALLCLFRLGTSAFPTRCISPFHAGSFTYQGTLDSLALPFPTAYSGIHDLSPFPIQCPST
jgi:hypothetical protein